ncbi:MAG: CHAD domain-containing protein [Candidatus Hydrogenedentes bacterium]|nr:CHAD domain-containing protein [Candidatus Hydrogenedentota bacterium]
MSASAMSPESGNPALSHAIGRAGWFPFHGTWEDALFRIERDWEAAGLSCALRVVHAGPLALLDTPSWDWYRAGVFFVRTDLRDAPFVVMMPSHGPAGFFDAVAVGPECGGGCPWHPSAFESLRAREAAWPAHDALEAQYASALRLVQYQLRHAEGMTSVQVLCMTGAPPQRDLQWACVILPEAMPGSTPSSWNTLCEVRQTWDGERVLRDVLCDALEGFLPLPDADLPYDADPGALPERHFARMQFYLPGTRLGVDPECLHQMRVAARRLGAAIRLLHGGGTGAALCGKTKSLERALGAVRDLDVIVERLKQHADESGLTHLEAMFAILEQRQRRAHEELLAFLGGDEFADTCAQFAAQVSAWSIAGLPEGAGEKVLEEVERLRLRVRREARRIAPDTDPERLHQLRRAFKRLRYHAEIAAAWKARRGTQLAEACARWQDLLGEHQDAVVASELIRDLAENTEAAGTGGRELYLALGEAIAVEKTRAAAVLQRFLRARDAGLGLKRCR